MLKILDYGCGKGYFAHYLARNNDEVYGADIEKNSLDFVKVNFPEIKCVLIETPKLPFPNGFFDEVYMMDVLEHIDDLESTTKEIARLVKGGGKIIVNVPAIDSEKWLLRIRPTYHEEIHHVRIFKDNEMETLWHKLGFELIKKRPKDFLENLSLYYLFSTAPSGNTQLSIGDWNKNAINKLVYIVFLMFSAKVLKTRLRYFPIWIFTLPIGILIEFIGNLYFPKSIYFEFSNSRRGVDNV